MENPDVARFPSRSKLWSDVFEALQKAAALAVLIMVHWGLQWLLRLSFGALPEYAKVEYWASTASLLAFILIYARLLFELVVIFFPLPKSAKSR